MNTVDKQACQMLRQELTEYGKQALAHLLNNIAAPLVLNTDDDIAEAGYRLAMIVKEVNGGSDA